MTCCIASSSSFNCFRALSSDGSTAWLVVVACVVAALCVLIAEVVDSKAAVLESGLVGGLGLEAVEDTQTDARVAPPSTVAE
jgi:hypothetical protein